MDKIKQWTMMVSAVSVISGVLISLLPQSSHKNLFKTITGLVLIYAFLQPIISGEGIDFNINDFLIDNYSVSNEIDKYALSSVVSSAEKAIADIIEDEAVKFGIVCECKCECKVENEQIIVESLSVRPTLDENEREKIEEIAESVGLSKNIIVFAGEKDEYR